jgi:subtilisin family serine protease
MSARSFLAATLVAAALVAGCNNESPISDAPTYFKILSGTNQSGDLGVQLDSSLVVQVLDAGSRPVANVPLTWTPTGGGTVSATATTTDADGKSSVKWTLSPAAGTQVVTVTSSVVTGVSVSFVATNGATVTGVVTPGTTSPFANFSLSPSRGARLSKSLSSSRTVSRRLSPNRIIVGFNSNTLGLAAAGTSAYRSMTTARAAVSRMQQSLTTLSRSLPISDAQISPAMLAARVLVTDAAQIEHVMDELRKQADVAWVERDEIVSIRDGAPRPMSAEFTRRFTDLIVPSHAPTGLSTSAVATRIPNDGNFYTQLWGANMLDLPKAWGITTGSANVIVAVIDMGIRFDHPDIAPNLTADGYDFVSRIGYGAPQDICSGGTFDTIDGDGDAADPDPTDPDDLYYDDFSGCWERETLGDHGLWTAGIIGAVGNEGIGMSGVNWTVKIRPVRVLGITGAGTSFDIAQGILYSAGLPATGANNTPVQAPSRAPIINLSLGTSASSNTLLTAVNAASNAGSLIVASAGNDGLDFPSYPAAYPNAMGVSAVGQDGTLATYSNAGTFISIAAPGGDYRLDDNGGGGVLGPGWNFVTGRSTYLFGYGTSASAPYVAGVAALMLAQTPSLTAANLRSRLESFATRPAGATRSDMLGWGIVNAYNSLTQTNGAPRATIVRLVDATTGVTSRAMTASSNGTFTFTRVANGSYYVQAGDDESGDGVLGLPGRRFGWFGGFGAPTAINVNNNTQAVALVLGLPTEVEPNNDVATANILVPGSYVVGNITTPDTRDVYSVVISTAGVYTFETTGLVGSCGMGVELDTFMSIQTQTGTSVGTNNDFTSATGRFCSRMQPTLQPGIHYVTITGSGLNGLANHGRYRLQVRSGI